MSIDRDPKTISWKAAFELVETAFAVCVESEKQILLYPKCNIISCIHFQMNDRYIIFKQCDNQFILVTKTGNLIFTDGSEKFELRLLNASPVIVP